MKILSSQDFKSSLPPNAKLLGLDMGTKTIGVAFADTGTRICTPLCVIIRKKLKEDARKLESLIRDYGAGGLVVGWPLNTDGTEGRRCQGVRDTILAMDAFLPDLSVTFWDERFSTASAETFLIRHIDMSRKKRDRVIDKMAALEIMNSFMDCY